MALRFGGTQAERDAKEATPQPQGSQKGAKPQAPAGEWLH